MNILNSESLTPENYTMGTFNFEPSHFGGYTMLDKFKLILISEKGIIKDEVIHGVSLFMKLKDIQFNELDLLEEHGNFILHVIDKNLSTLFSIEYKKEILE